MSHWVHYVYELADPRTGEAFYVGKGIGNRLRSHEKAVRGGKSSGNLAKDLVIRSILDAGMRVVATVVSLHPTSADAYAAEAKRIKITAGLVNKEVPSGLTPCQIGALKLAEDIYQRLRRKVLGVIALQDKGKLQSWQVSAAIRAMEIYLRMDADRASSASR